MTTMTIVIMMMMTTMTTTMKTTDAVTMRKLFTMDFRPMNDSNGRRHRKFVSARLPLLRPKLLLDYHNKVRREEGAANMIELRWDRALAKNAKNWIRNCQFGHPKAYVPSILRQNVHFTTLTYKNYVNDGAADWFSEKLKYDFETSTCKEDCEAYFTMVKWDLTLMGCAVTRCSILYTNFDAFSDAAYLSCEYYSPINDLPAFPYISGPPCSKCPENFEICMDGLCTGPDSSYPLWDVLMLSINEETTPINDTLLEVNNASEKISTRNLLTVMIMIVTTCNTNINIYGI